MKYKKGDKVIIRATGTMWYFKEPYIDYPVTGNVLLIQDPGYLYTECGIKHQQRIVNIDSIEPLQRIQRPSPDILEALDVVRNYLKTMGE